MNAPQSSTFKMFDGVSTVDLQSENQMSKLLIVLSRSRVSEQK